MPRKLEPTAGGGDATAKVDFSQLPRWAKLALARVELYNETPAEAAKLYHRSESMLEKYSASPAGRRWRDSIKTIADDPDEVARILMRASTLGVAFDALWALEHAREAGDYKEVGVIARDLMNRRQDVFPKLNEEVAAPTIIINLQASSLEPTVISSSHSRQLEAAPVDADFEVVD